MRLPIRIQRSCARGWRTPAHAKYVGPGSMYSNPFRVARSPFELKFGGALVVESHAEAVEKFREWIRHTAEDAVAFVACGVGILCWVRGELA